MTYIKWFLNNTFVYCNLPLWWKMTDKKIAQEWFSFQNWHLNKWKWIQSYRWKQKQANATIKLTSFSLSKYDSITLQSNFNLY